MGRSRINAGLGMKVDYRLEDAEVRSRQVEAVWTLELGLVFELGLGL